MKILLCTTTFQRITHGPAKFANILLEHHHLIPDLEVRVLTEDIAKPLPNKVYGLKLNYPRPLHALGRFFRMHHYYVEAMEIRKSFYFDVLLFNDAMQGLLATYLKPKDLEIVGMLNDNENLIINWSNCFKSRKNFIRFLFKMVEKWAIKKVDLTFVNSNFLKKMVLSYYDNKSEKIKVLYKAINLDQWPFNGSLRIDLAQKIKVVFVKSDFWRGGLSTLVEALGYLKSYNFELFVIGPNQRYEQTIVKMCANYTNIQLAFKGPRTQKEVYEIMRTSHILSVPSWREALGVVNMEGLAVGIPVISTSAGGIPEVLGNGQFGWLASAADVNHLAQTIEQCLVSEAERNAKSKAGRLHVEKHFHCKLMIETLVRSIKTLE